MSTPYTRANPDAAMVLDFIRAHPAGTTAPEIGMAFPELSIPRRVAITRRLLSSGLIRKAGTVRIGAHTNIVWRASR